MTTTVVNKRRAEFDVNIGRPSKWGNPFVIGRDGDRAEVIRKHLIWIEGQQDLLAVLVKELRGKTLGCYCAPAPCHGDTLAALADSDRIKQCEAGLRMHGYYVDWCADCVI